MCVEGPCLGAFGPESPVQSLKPLCRGSARTPQILKMSQAERATVPFQRAGLHPASHLEPFLEFISTFLPLDILLPHFPLRFKSRALKSSLETLDAGVGCGHGTCAELGWLGHNSLCPRQDISGISPSCLCKGGRDMRSRGADLLSLPRPG